MCLCGVCTLESSCLCMRKPEEGIRFHPPSACFFEAGSLLNMELLSQLSCKSANPMDLLVFVPPPNQDDKYLEGHLA